MHNILHILRMKTFCNIYIICLLFYTNIAAPNYKYFLIIILIFAYSIKIIPVLKLLIREKYEKIYFI